MATAQVLVVGGGPAGIGAAIAAAETGADVILVERHGFLGGNATAALVMPLMSFHTRRAEMERAEETGRLFPRDHGPGEPVVQGVLARLLERLTAVGGATAPSRGTGYTVPFDPEIFKWVALQMLDEAGVRFLFHSFASEVVERKDGHRGMGVVFETKSGPIVIDANVVVDCTGDGDIAAKAGATYEIGREEDGLTQPMTLMFRIGEFERGPFQQYVKDHPDQWRGVLGLWDLIEKATKAGKLNLAREDLLFFDTTRDRELSVNSTRVAGLGNDVWDLTRAEWEARRQMAEIVRFLKEEVPGFANSYAIQSGVTVGVRETRRIMGEYLLTASDIMRAQKFPDVVARGSYPMDVHNPTGGSGTSITNLPPGEAYDIPRGCLLPRGVEHVVVAGRCISGTHEAHSSYRVMPIGMATGHGAGTMSALAALHDCEPCDVPILDLQRALVAQGADLGGRTSQIPGLRAPALALDP